MRYSSFIAGIVMFLLLASGAEAKPLYDTIKESIEREIVTKEPEEAIVKYLHAIYGEKWDLTEDDVKQILSGDGKTVCGEKESGEDSKDLVGCENMTQDLMQGAAQEGRVRELGRLLQTIATSYELPLSEIPGHPIKFSTDLRGIVNIWSTEGTLSGLGGSSSSASSGGSSSSEDENDPPVFLPDNPIYPRTQPLTLLDSGEENQFQQLLGDLRSALDELSDEEKTAAVWRYMYGARLVRENREPDYPPPYEDGQSGPGTERQYLFKRWEKVEAALMALWDWDEKFPKDPAAYDPPLEKNDVVYFLFPEPLSEDLLLWLRVDGDDPAHLMGDVGLHFAMPLDPVLPSLTHEDEPILGGTYPPEPMTEPESEEDPEPVDGRRLCSMPAAQRGYLCRPFEASSDENACPPLGASDPSGNPLDPTAIHLTNCILGNTGATIAGPDVCREIPWREQTFDIQINCRVAMRCAEKCGEVEEHLGYTSPKNADGVIEICLENSPDVPMSYILYHELIHAYQNCGEPPKDSIYENMNADEASAACCRREGEAYRAHCQMMEEDGIIGPTVIVDGIPVTAENCAEFFTNIACSGESIEDDEGNPIPLQGCPTSRIYPDSMFDQLLEKVKENPKDIPATCSEAINNPDLRVETLLRTIETRDPVCTISSLTEYKNRIGNELCFIGQCMEESLELHRLVPGRSPAGVGDQAFPWDHPLTGSPPLGNLLTNSPAGPGFLPQYRPELLAQEFETALCQLQGLPARTPPILCAIDTNRRLDFPLKDFFPTVSGLITQNEEGDTVNADLLNLSMGVGARMGTNLYSAYLRVTSRSLAETLTSAKDLLTDIKNVEFPTQMCPTGSFPLLAPGT